MLGKLLALPFRILNAPVRGVEKLVGKMCGSDDIPESDRILSLPLETIASAIEEIEEK